MVQVETLEFQCVVFVDDGFVGLWLFVAVDVIRDTMCSVWPYGGGGHVFHCGVGHGRPRGLSQEDEGTGRAGLDHGPDTEKERHSRRISCHVFFFL